MRHRLFSIGLAFAVGLSSLVLLTAFLRDPNIFATQQWSYAAATGGIDNSAVAVTIKAAVANERNYIEGCQFQHATLGGATEFAIRDGAAGTVLWRTGFPTTAMALTGVQFDPPLRGSVNTLVEVITLTGVTGDVFVNCQGYVGP